MGDSHREMGGELRHLISSGKIAKVGIGKTANSYASCHQESKKDTNRMRKYLQIMYLIRHFNLK